VDDITVVDTCSYTSHGSPLESCVSVHVRAGATESVRASYSSSNTFRIWPAFMPNVAPDGRTSHDESDRTATDADSDSGWISVNSRPAFNSFRLFALAATVRSPADTTSSTCVVRPS